MLFAQSPPVGLAGGGDGDRRAHHQVERATRAQMAGQMPVGTEDKAIRRIEGIVDSMTPGERSKPELIKASRKRRIAAGAGVQVQEVNRLLKQFEQTQKMMKQFSKGGIGKLMRGMKGMLPGMR